MWLNYIKIAFRNLRKYKLYTLINISGLAIGIASFILIWIYIFDELRYDKHHSNSKNIFRLVNVYDFEGVGETSASSPFPVAWALKKDYPHLINNTVRIFNRQVPRTLIQYDDKIYNERRFFFADSSYFQIFDHEFIMGSGDNALDEINSVVITESTAKKYFGSENPMGKTFRLENFLDLKVTAVIKDVPNNSHFKFDLLTSLSTMRKPYGGSLPKTWVWNPCWTYFLMDKSDTKELESFFPYFVDKYFYDAEKENISLYLQKLEDIHLRSKLDYEIEPNSNIKYVRILQAIAFFLLIIAIINYVNLSTATSAGRAREIGIKKVFGVSRRQLIYQFLFESILLSLLALLASLFLIELVLPALNTFSGKNIVFAQLLEVKNMLYLLLIGAGTGFIAGLYPAIYLSVFNPILVLNNKLSEVTKSGLGRKTLVVAQFIISIILIILTLNVYHQTRYLTNADTGFDKEDIILLPVSGTSIAKSYDSFKDELLQNPHIKSVTTIDDILGVAHNTHEFRPEGLAEDKWQFYPALVIGYDFLNTFDIDILEGRDYDENMKTDPVNGILINEAMVKHQGWNSNEEAIGKKFSSLGGKEKVIGVFENFNATSLHEQSGPFVLNIKESKGATMFFLKYVAIKIDPNNKKEVVSFIENKWNKAEKGRPFEYTWLNDELSALYDDEIVLGSLSLIISIIIIFVAMLGLFGLASFMSEQRNKEIGIRKVFGAGQNSIIKLLTTEFMYLLVIAVAFAWPLSFLLIDEWLNYFAYRADIDYWSFVYGALIAIVLALIITISRAIIASKSNPIDTLKYE